MIIKTALTKENAFNKLKDIYPESMKMFCDWIDEYKKDVNWLDLFNDGYEINYNKMGRTIAPKFHQLPHAFQLGIWITFCLEHGLFTNVESDFDLLEDMEEAFKEYSRFFTKKDNL